MSVLMSNPIVHKGIASHSQQRMAIGPLTGKVALVSGCARARGFGRAIARRLAQAGADLVMTDVSPGGLRVVESKPDSEQDGLDSAVEEIQRMGRRASAAIADVRSVDGVNAVVEQALKTFDRLDILVNNAAAAPGADRVPFVELSEDAWDTVIDTNLKGPFLLTRAAATVMLRQGVGGRIINVASTTGKIPYAKMAAYSASKAGLLGLSRAMALELAPAQITVNAVCPGVADTDRIDYVGIGADGMYDPELRTKRLAARGAGIPLGRVATSEDVAAVVAFLASDDAQYLTGEFINIAGGYVMD
ncbi:MAG: SDR family oxidoreductase [Myxococcales bacterium]|nr:SDR family oxidoreductase [Myxococcales bacterium]